MKLTEDQFWALERWIISLATQAVMPAGYYDPANADAIRETARIALTADSPTPTPPGREVS